MSDCQPTCSKCQRVMEEGIIPDAAHYGALQAQAWQDKMPEERNFLGLKIPSIPRAEKRFSVTTYRCVNCGYLESYAR